MRIIQVVPSIALESSGPAYSVPGLCRALSLCGVDVTMTTLGPVPEWLCQESFDVKAYHRRKFPHPSLGRSPEMLKGLKDACRSAEIIHNNSLWMMPNIYAAQAKQGTRCKLVTAPRGTLAAWSLKRSRLKKKMIGWYGQFSALRGADMFHATCQKEYEEIRGLGFRQPVAIVPIGMDIPAVEHGKASGLRHVLFFGRLHEVKAVDRLILAWGKVADKFPDWDLQIAGPDAGDEQRLKRIVRENNIPRVSFIGEVCGQEKYRLLANVDLYVLPSKTENFAVTVAEALASGTPVIASNGTPWSGLDKHKCGWWGFKDENSLAALLHEVLAMDRDALREIGQNGARWIKQDFSWPAIGRQMMSAYEWLLKAGPRPGCVVED